MSIIPSPGPAPTVTPRGEFLVFDNERTVAAGEVIHVRGDNVVFRPTYTGSGARLVNNGVIWLDSGMPQAFLISNGAHNIVNGGTIYIRGQSQVSLAPGTPHLNSLTNTGSIFVISEGGFARGIETPTFTATIENSGLIAVQSLGLNPNQLSIANAIGIDAGNTVSFVNNAAGRLLVEAYGLAIGVSTSAANAGTAPIVNNAGLIEAAATGEDGISIGIEIVNPGYNVARIVNTGTIRADIAIFAAPQAASVVNPQEIVENRAGGVIVGTVFLDDGDDELINDGFINGTVRLGDGNDIYRGSGAVSTVTDMGFGNDRYTGAAWDDRVIGGRGNDVLTGNGGLDILVGGFGNDILDGGLQNDTLIGEWGNDTIRTLGGDYVEGNDGNDRVELGDFTFRAVHGGNGTDTLVMAIATRDFDLGEILASGRVTGFEIVELMGAQRLLIDAATARDFVGKGLPPRIVGGGSNTVFLDGAWTQSGTTVVDGVNYARWVNGSAHVLITPGVIVQLASGQDFGGLDAIASGTAAPQLGPSAGIDYSSPAVLLLSHIVRGEGFTVDVEEIFFSDGREVFYADTTTTLTNNGLIESYTTTASAGIGIRFGGNATVINNGIIDVQQLVPQSEDGTIFYYLTIGIERGGGNGDGERPFENHGEIFVYSLAGAAVGLNSPFAFVNTGLITVVSEDYRAIGVNATYGSDNVNFTQRFFNTGTIYVEAGGYGRQVGIEGDRHIPEIYVASGVFSWGSLVNDGNIIAVLDDDADQTLQTVGVYVNSFFNNAANPATVTNNGLIVGTTAITFRDQAGNGLPNRVVNNGTLVGNVVFLDSSDTYDGTRGRIEGTVFGFGGNDTLTGGAFADRFNGGAGNDTINGGGNVDTAVVRGLRSAYTVTQTATGVFQVVGPDGTDTLTAVEFLQFDDQILRLRPGTGVTVNFNTPNTADYQTAMNAIRDFDGNTLGGSGSWLRIGQADVNGDGDVDQILVNRSIARFATVGTAPDGLVYFSDHGWAGETRVAGIYIDPLVEAGIVVAGSPNDSQRRFLNDLAIENINRVLGANDYNRDGIHEVYFALTDGTAYLRALMHADGNIRYANYQSQQEVIDYLTANGFGPSTWAGWFTAPSSAATQVSVDAQEANALGRAAMRGEEAAMPGSIDPASLAFIAPAIDDQLRAEFYG
jgi:hypothetical protein